jgi:WD40 repeat protein
MINANEKKINQIQPNERQQNISNLCDVHILKDLADLTSNYDYYIEGESHILDNMIPIAVVKTLPDGRIACKTTYNELKIWNPCTGIYDSVLESSLNMNHITITQKGTIFCCTNEGSIKLWDPKTNMYKDICAEYTFYNAIYFVIDLLDGRIAAGGHNNEIKIININTGAVERVLYGSAASYCEPLPNESSKSNSVERIICVNMNDFKIWNISSGVCEFHLDYDMICIKLLPDGRICCGLDNGKILILRREKKSCNYVTDVTLEGHVGQVRILLILSNGLLVSGSDDNCALKIWNLEDKIELMTLEGHTKPITCIAELPDGRIISGSHDCTLKIWNLTNTDPKKRCEMTLNHSTKVCKVDILPNGQIVSGTELYTFYDKKQMQEDNGALIIWN